MDSMTSLFEYIFVAYGVYILFHWVQVALLKKDFAAKTLLPQNMTDEGCEDRSGLNRFMAPRLLVMGLILVGLGVLPMVNRALGLLEGLAATAVHMGLFLAFFALYFITVRQARQRFW